MGMLETIPSEQTVTFLKRLRETGPGKLPSMHCLRKGDLSVLLASIWLKDGAGPSGGILRTIQSPLCSPSSWASHMCLLACIYQTSLWQRPWGRLGWTFMTGHWELPSVPGSLLGLYWSGHPSVGLLGYQPWNGVFFFLFFFFLRYNWYTTLVSGRQHNDSVFVYITK